MGVCIALGALKPAHMLQPAATCWQRLVCADIGIETSHAKMHRLAPPQLHRPGPAAHNYSRGLVAVVGCEMAGAGRLASQAAAHGGSGMVRHLVQGQVPDGPGAIIAERTDRSEEHTSELQSLMRISYAVFCLKKKN